MPSIDRTPDFRQIVRDKQKGQPEKKSHRAHRTDTDKDGHMSLGKEYLAEAYSVVRSSIHANAFLALIMASSLSI